MNSVGTMFDRILKRPQEPKVVLGKIEGKLFAKEELTDSEQNHHVHILGASGFGKTVLLSHLIRQRIEQGRGLMFLDLKGDRETIEKFTGFAKACGREADVQILSLGHIAESTPYNLIGTGTPTQIRDRIMMSLNWSEEFYRNQSSSFLLKVLIGACWLRDTYGGKLNIRSLHELLASKESIEELCAAIPMDELEVRKPLEEVVQSCIQSDYWNSLQGLRTQIESLVLSDYRKLISSNEGAEIDLFRSATESKLVFMFLDSRRYGETAKAVGRFVIQDLKAVSARIEAEIPKTERKPFSVIIDEFSDLAQEDFIAFLDRARSSKFSIVVAHQEISDLQRISPEFTGRLMGNTSTIYAFLQKRAESAEQISSVAGTRATAKKTERYSRFLFFNIPTGEISVREVEEFILHPNEVKGLRVGECVCIKKYPYARAHKVKIFAE